MTARIKFAKYGAMKFIGHLDVMRYFQKLIRRTGVNVSYSQGYHPHQLMSFAAPLGVGITSEGEYVDVELNSFSSEDELKADLNSGITEGFRIISVRLLPETPPNQKKASAMSLVTAADYRLIIKDGYCCDFSGLAERQEILDGFIAQKEIMVVKKTKKSENEMNIRPYIYSAACPEEEGFSFRLAAGSVMNLKPELVLGALYDYCGKKLTEYSYQIHRLELLSGEGEFTPLLST